MERTVPEVASEEIELYLRTSYSLLRASTEVRIRTVEEAHAGMKSLLHPLARSPQVDMSAFIYSLLRLPKEIIRVELVVLGQSFEVFAESGIHGLENWQEVFAPARRRRCYYDGDKRLACLISSRSDIDDLIPILTAYQIEWNKFNTLLRSAAGSIDYQNLAQDEEKLRHLALVLGLDPDDLQQLVSIWKESFDSNFNLMAKKRIDLRLQMLNGSLAEYRRAIHRWWKQIESNWPEIKHQPVYFVSSNAHSLVNLVTGFAIKRQKELLDFLEKSEDEGLIEEWEKIQAAVVPSSRENFFYYLLKKAQGTPFGDPLMKERAAYEEAHSIVRARSKYSFDIESQIIPLAQIDPQSIDPRLRRDVTPMLEKSDAVILNIDYPLGLAAYQVMSEIADHVGKVLGVYIIGKSATLNGVVGDVMIPNVVYDGQSLNTYLFSNCFKAGDVSPYLVYGTVLDNQKAVSVRGTFLQNHDYMDVFYREGYTDIEMEAGPYLSAVYEMNRMQRHPRNEIVNLFELPFDLGMLHYASDKPLSKGRNLGAASLSYFGMDPTYATAAAALKRIFKLERLRLEGR